MSTFDPSREWDRYCDLEEDNMRYEGAQKVVEALKKQDIAISLLDPGAKKMHFYQGERKSVDWIYNEIGEVDIEAMVGVLAAALRPTANPTPENSLSASEYELMVHEIALATLSADHEQIAKMLDVDEDTLCEVHQRLLHDQGMG